MEVLIDLGGAYQSKRPVRSLHNYRILIRLCDELGFRLAEDFFCLIHLNYLPN